MKHLLLFFFLAFTAANVSAQIDTTSYPDQRREILELLHKGAQGGDKSCGDFIAVGPKGDISFSRKEWIEVQKKMKLVFKSMRIIPGSEVVRVYDGTSAVVNFVADVALVVDGKDVALKVRRLEVYHKTGTGWCMVAGQGTEVDEGLFPVRE
jgi:hypothetical protein